MADEAPPVAAVSVKLPQFWKHDPAAWFAYAQSTFNLRNIRSSRTKFDYVVTSLPCELISEISDILAAPDNDDPYETLKAALISRTSISERERLRQLLSKEDLGDRKPTQLLRHMQGLLGSNITFDAKILRELFTQRLPTHVQTVIAATPAETSIEALATIADRVMEVDSTNNICIAQVKSRVNQKTTSANDLEQQVTDLVKQVSNLTTLVEKLTANDRSRSRTPTRFQSTEQRSQTPQRDVCFFHHKFGDKARKCRSPCNYKGNENREC